MSRPATSRRKLRSTFFGKPPAYPSPSGDRHEWAIDRRQGGWMSTGGDHHGGGDG